MITILEKNKDFIAQESIAFLANSYPAYEFDREICRRDVHMIIDIVAGELHLEGAMHPALNADPELCENFWQLNRFKRSFRTFRKQNPATIDTMNFTGELIKLLLQNLEPASITGGVFKQVKAEHITITPEELVHVDTVLSLIVANSGAGSVRSPGIEFIEEYFDKGFVVTETPKDIHARLWDEVNNTNWVPGVGNTYKMIPDWYQQKKRRYTDPTGADRQVTERWEGLYGYYHAPQSLKDIAADLIADPFFDTLKLYRPPNAIPKFIHFWNGSENTQHHVDSIDGSDVMIFCYATESKEWKEEWGGYINLMKEVNNEFYYTRNVLPNDGTMVVVNNSAPIFKHGIRDLLNQEINRYTFIFHYTWDYDRNEKID
jgi:hypothetical protein